MSLVSLSSFAMGVSIAHLCLKTLPHVLDLLARQGVA